MPMLLSYKKIKYPDKLDTIIHGTHSLGHYWFALMVLLVLNTQLLPLLQQDKLGNLIIRTSSIRKLPIVFIVASLFGRHG